VKLRAGLKTLIGVSIVEIALAIYDIIACPLAALLSFTAAERLDTQQHQELTEHGTAISTLRRMPVKKTDIFTVEASFLAIPLFLAVIVLCYLILRRWRFQLFGVPITPQFMGLVVLLIGFWNLLFSVFLFGVRGFYLRAELL
jgi:hypothetical protein